jgi:hypothetical protein
VGVVYFASNLPDGLSCKREVHKRCEYAFCVVIIGA